MNIITSQWTVPESVNAQYEEQRMPNAFTSTATEASPVFAVSALSAVLTVYGLDTGSFGIFAVHQTSEDGQVLDEVLLKVGGVAVVLDASNTRQVIVEQGLYRVKPLVPAPNSVARVGLTFTTRYRETPIASTQSTSPASPTIVFPRESISRLNVDSLYDTPVQNPAIFDVVLCSMDASLGVLHGGDADNGAFIAQSAGKFKCYAHLVADFNVTTNSQTLVDILVSTCDIKHGTTVIGSCASKARITYKENASNGATTYYGQFEIDAMGVADLDVGDTVRVSLGSNIGTGGTTFNSFAFTYINSYFGVTAL